MHNDNVTAILILSLLDELIEKGVISKEDMDFRILNKFNDLKSKIDKKNDNELESVYLHNVIGEA